MQAWNSLTKLLTCAYLFNGFFSLPIPSNLNHTPSVPSPAEEFKLHFKDKGHLLYDHPESPSEHRKQWLFTHPELSPGSKVSKRTGFESGRSGLLIGVGQGYHASRLLRSRYTVGQEGRGRRGCRGGVVGYGRHVRGGGRRLNASANVLHGDHVNHVVKNCSIPDARMNKIGKFHGKAEEQGKRCLDSQESAGGRVRGSHIPSHDTLERDAHLGHTNIYLKATALLARRWFHSHPGFSFGSDHATRPGFTFGEHELLRGVGEGGDDGHGWGGEGGGGRSGHGHRGHHFVGARVHMDPEGHLRFPGDDQDDSDEAQGRSDSRGEGGWGREGGGGGEGESHGVSHEGIGHGIHDGHIRMDEGGHLSFHEDEDDRHEHSHHKVVRVPVYHLPQGFHGGHGPHSYGEEDHHHHHDHHEEEEIHHDHGGEHEHEEIHEDHGGHHEHEEMHHDHGGHHEHEEMHEDHGGHHEHEEMHHDDGGHHEHEEMHEDHGGHHEHENNHHDDHHQHDEEDHEEHGDHGYGDHDYHHKQSTNNKQDSVIMAQHHKEQMPVLADSGSKAFADKLELHWGDDLGHGQIVKDKQHQSLISENVEMVGAGFAKPTRPPTKMPTPTIPGSHEPERKKVRFKDNQVELSGNQERSSPRPVTHKPDRNKTNYPEDEVIHSVKQELPESDHKSPNPAKVEQGVSVDHGNPKPYSYEPEHGNDHGPLRPYLHEPESDNDRKFEHGVEQNTHAQLASGDKDVFLSRQSKGGSIHSKEPNNPENRAPDDSAVLDAAHSKVAKAYTFDTRGSGMREPITSHDLETKPNSEEPPNKETTSDQSTSSHKPNENPFRTKNDSEVEQRDEEAHDSFLGKANSNNEWASHVKIVLPTVGDSSSVIDTTHGSLRAPMKNVHFLSMRGRNSDLALSLGSNHEPSEMNRQTPNADNSVSTVSLGLAGFKKWCVRLHMEKSMRQKAK